VSNPSKRKGTAWEVDCRDHLRCVFPEVERLPTEGQHDRGDLGHVGPWAIECKAERAINLAGYMDEAVREAGNAGKPYPVVFVKRRNRRVGDGYAVMRIDDWLRVASQLEGVG